jgi:integrase
VRFATWDEIDFANKLWTVPASRMKAGKAHHVPLSEPAIALLRALPRHAGTDLVFTVNGKRPVSDSTLSKMTREMGYDATPHGFRSSFKDWARSSTAYADEVSELALAHVATDATRAAYARDELLPKRKALMSAWAKYLATIPTKGNVVQIGARHA